MTNLLNVILLIFLNNGEYFIISPEMNLNAQSPFILEHKKLTSPLTRAGDLDSTLITGNNSFIYYIDEKQNKLLNYGHIKDIIGQCPIRDEYRNEWIIGNKNSSILTFNMFDFNYNITDTPSKRLANSFMFLTTAYDLYSYNEEFLESQHLRQTIINPITFSKRKTISKEKEKYFLLDSKIFTLPEPNANTYESFVHNVSASSKGNLQFEMVSHNRSLLKTIDLGGSIHSIYQISFFSRHTFIPFVKSQIDVYKNITVSSLYINQHSEKKSSANEQKAYMDDKNELVSSLDDQTENGNFVRSPLVPMNKHMDQQDKDNNLVPIKVYKIPPNIVNSHSARTAFVDEVLAFDYLKIISLLCILLILFLICIQIKHIIKEYKNTNIGNGLNKIIVYKEKVLGRGEGGTVVFEGKFEGRDVAVKRILKVNFDKVKKEVDSLIKADSCPYILRYFTVEEDESFYYLALEKCAYNLETYLKHKNKSIPKKQIMLSVAKGVEQIHSVGLIHRDIKPQNILIDEKENVKLADLGIAKELDSNTTTNKYGTLIWMPPEYAIEGIYESSNNEKTKGDIFSLGCLFYYILTNGKHPFGEEKERIKNLISNDYKMNLKPIKISIREILQMMMNRDPKERPFIKDVLSYPYFWTPDVKIKFIVKASDKLETEFRYGGLITYLNICGHQIYDAKKGWKDKMDDKIVKEIEGFRGYDSHSFLDFLRAFRNIWNHFNDIKSAATIIGYGAENYLKYYQKLFPGFILFLWSALSDCEDITKGDLKEYYAGLSKVVTKKFKEKKIFYKTRSWYKTDI